MRSTASISNGRRSPKKLMRKPIQRAGDQHHYSHHEQIAMQRLQCMPAIAKPQRRPGKGCFDGQKFLAHDLGESAQYHRAPGNADQPWTGDW